MSTIVSARKEVVSKSEPRKYDGIFLSVAGLVVGVALMILGAQLTFNAGMILGFLAFAASLLYLNTQFWGWVYERHGKNIPTNGGNHFGQW